jgi:hypothetical protein
MATSDHVPVRSAPRLAATNSHVVLQSRIVEHSSNYTSPAFLVPKGGGNFHLVVLVDYVPQNENVVRDSSSIPDPESTFDCFLSVTGFSLPDTNSACYGVSLSPSSRWYTFCGLYEFVKVTVGVVSAGML